MTAPAMRTLLEALVKELVAKGVCYDDARREFERRFIEHALAKAEGSVSGAAEVMGVHRNTLTRKIAEYQIRS
jgi:DNA-binding NtrC family response regulator